MKRRHHTPEQIVRKLREADRMLGEGTALVEVCKHLEVTEQTYYRWRNQYGGMKADVHGHEKVPTGGHVDVSAGGHLKVPALHG